MKIGIDASRYGHELSTGVECYSFQIINHLLNNLQQEDVILYSREKIEGYGDKNKVLDSKRLWTLWALSKEMRNSPPDVLFVPSHVLPLSLPKRSVIMIHDVAFRHLKEAYSFLQYHYLNWSTKFAVKNATKIIVPSEATAKDLQVFYDCPREKIEIVHHGFAKPDEVDEEVFEKSEVFRYFEITKNMKYVFFVGRLENKKNLLRLVEAFAEFSKKFPDYKLVLAGKRGLGFKDILKKVNTLELMHKVIMPGYVTEQEKAVLYKNCAFFAFPSLYEGFGFPILEAFHYGKPVLTANNSSMPELAREAAVYVDPFDVESISDALLTIAEGGEYVDELIKKGYERLKDFSWSRAAEQTLKILKNGQ